MDQAPVDAVAVDTTPEREDVDVTNPDTEGPLDSEETMGADESADPNGQETPDGGTPPQNGPAAEGGDGEPDESSGEPIIESGIESGTEAEQAAESEAGADAEADEETIDASDGKSAGPGPGAELTDEQIVERATALLFASPEPLSVGQLVGLLERPETARVRAALKAISHQLEASSLPFQLRALKGGYTLMTVPELGDVVGRLSKGSPIEKISPAALETLAIVAYRQPVTKAEIEAIRGVQAGPILRSLVDRGLAKVTGRADVPGHPLQYGTTKDFLDRFGLMSLDDLPRDAELAKD